MSYSKSNNISFTGKPSSPKRTGGRFGDSLIAFMSPEQKTMLEQQGATGTINPDTGLPEYINFQEMFTPTEESIAANKAAGAKHTAKLERERIAGGGAVKQTYAYDSEEAKLMREYKKQGQYPTFGGQLSADIDEAVTNYKETGGPMAALFKGIGNIFNGVEQGPAITTHSAHVDEFASVDDLAKELEKSDMEEPEDGFLNFANGLINFGLVALNPAAGVGMGLGKQLSKFLGIGGGLNFGPEIKIVKQEDGSYGINAGLGLDIGAGIGVMGTPIQAGVGQQLASAGVTFSADGVETYTSGLEGSSTSGDNSSNIGTAIDQSEGSESTAGELASTDGETTFGQYAANEAGPAHINPAEYASLQAAGYAPQILSSNFGNFDDIQYVNPNAPI